MADLHPEVIEAQRALATAWAKLEAHRKAVDADRAKTEQAPETVWQSPIWRDWPDEESATYDELHAAVLAAGQSRAEIMARHQVVSSWDTERALRAAVREPAEA